MVPQHKIDGRGVFVHPHDAGWNDERIGRERNLLLAAWELRIAAEAERSGQSVEKLKKAQRPPIHPLTKYFAGTTRFGLDVPIDSGKLGLVDETSGEFRTTITAREYLTPPFVGFVLRRLKPRQFAEVGGMIEDPRTSRLGYLRAIELGLAGIEGGDDVGLHYAEDKGKLDEDFLSELVQVPNIIEELGPAIVLFSQRMTFWEKKP